MTSYRYLVPMVQGSVTGLKLLADFVIVMFYDMSCTPHQDNILLLRSFKPNTMKLETI